MDDSGKEVVHSLTYSLPEGLKILSGNGDTVFGATSGFPPHVSYLLEDVLCGFVQFWWYFVSFINNDSCYVLIFQISEPPSQRVLHDRDVVGKGTSI